MTSPGYSERHTEIVNEMVGRLRVLQGSGEYVPLGRRITAGEGLAGGGTLEGDVSVSLTPEAAELLAAVSRRGDLSELVTVDDVVEFLVDYQLKADVPSNVTYRDFTVTDSPDVLVSSPPLRMDRDATVTSVRVSMKSPSSSGVTVRVNGVVVSAAAGVDAVKSAPELFVKAEEAITVEVDPTDAEGILVSLRIEEDE